MTAPIVFVVAGAVIRRPPRPRAWMRPRESRWAAKPTLALILFHDAAQVPPRQIEADRGLVLRLLLGGFAADRADRFPRGANGVPGDAGDDGVAACRGIGTD